jgi:hypothetical protein
MKMYLVSSGQYSDYSVLGIYSTKEKADEAVAIYAADNDIEEWDVDDLPPHPPGEFRWSITMLDNGDVASISNYPAGLTYAPLESYRPFWPSQKNRRVLILWARDKEHAVKIASEKRREMIVNDEWYSDKHIGKCVAARRGRRLEGST